MVKLEAHYSAAAEAEPLPVRLENSAMAVRCISGKRWVGLLSGKHAASARGRLMTAASAAEASRCVREAGRSDGGVGPILFARGWHGDRLLLTALLVRPADTPAPELTTREAAFAAEPVALRGGFRVWRYVCATVESTAIVTAP